MSTPSVSGTAGDPVGEVTQRRDRMQATLDELQRVVDLDDNGDGQWRKAVAAALAEAAATWERHVSGSEAPEGILADVVEREPRLVPLVDTLLAEHTEIRALLERTNSTLATLDPSAARQEVQAVANRFSRHHDLGAELIHHAYEVDLGGNG